MSSTLMIVVAAAALMVSSSASAGGLFLMNSSQATAPPTLAPGSQPTADAAAPPADNPFLSTGGAPSQTAPTGGESSQTNPFAPTGGAPSPGTNTSVSSPSGTTKPSTSAPKKNGVAFRKPRTAAPRRPSPKTTAPARVRTKQECRDAVYNWFNGEVWPKVDKNVGYSTDTKWYDPTDSANVRAACGGCMKKDEYGVTIGKAVGVKRYNDEWDDTRRSKLWDEGTRGWIASYMTENLPGTCS